ncbi:hypothetical protein [Streptomyces californicus]|uniref:hypothetical protein n=1 Tax=Streptomyces californicus TaxID=67351 RepID=UPI0036768D69
MTDPDPDVRLAVSFHPALSEEERARIDYQVPVDHFFVHQPVPEAPRDPGAVRRDALSRHPLLRRRAAGDHLLPPDLVARLTSDDDLGVRVLPAQNRPDAPASLLLRSFLEYTGPERSHLTTRPNFPTGGLAVFADHEDPEVRALAARAPEIEPTTRGSAHRGPGPCRKGRGDPPPASSAAPAGSTPRRRGVGPPCGGEHGAALGHDLPTPTDGRATGKAAGVERLPASCPAPLA